MSRDALIVGINSYDRLNRLNLPSKDAEAIAQLLEQYGDFRVTRLPEVIDKSTEKIKVGERTKVNFTDLETALVQLFLPEGRNIPDTALFYFAGHGVRKTLGISEGFLACSDTSPKTGNWGLRLKWLRELLQASPIKQQIILLDCCFSGELLNFDEANPGEKGLSRDRCFIAASREFEVAYEDIAGNHGVLTEFLVQGLDPTRQLDGKVSNLGLTAFINRALEKSTQRPIHANFGGEIILTRVEKIVEHTDSKIDSSICPYKGLEFFDCADAPFFYGRRELTDQLLDKVRASNFVAVLGASGSGKSSVVRAGLLHELNIGRRLSGSEHWTIRIFRPSDSPLHQLALAFVDEKLSDIERAKQLGDSKSLIAKGAEGLSSLIEVNQSPRVVLLIDQFEEVFTLCQQVAEKQAFFECLLGALDTTHDKLCLIITMRADFFGKCTEQAYAGLANRIQDNLITVQPMRREALQTAIVEPAKKANLVVESELVERMLTDVENAPSSLPLLQYALMELWKERKNNRLTLATYEQLGGVHGALKNRADSLYASLSPEQQSVAKWIFLELTQLGEGTEDTRKQVFKQDLITAQHGETLIDETLLRLTDARLVVTSAVQSRGEGEKSLTIVDVAHEALIRHWTLLRQWISENRQFKAWRDRLRLSVKEWQAKNKHKDLLLRGAVLAEAEEKSKQYQALLNENEKRFVKASVHFKKVFRSALVAIFMITVMLSGVATWQWWESQQKGAQLFEKSEQLEKSLNETELARQKAEESEQIALQKSEQLAKSLRETELARQEAEKSEQAAKEQAKIALSEKLVAQSVLATLSGHYESTLLLAVQAFKQKDTVTTRSNLLRVLQAQPQSKSFLYAHFDWVFSVAFSPDGKILASSSWDKTIILWDVEKGQAIGQPLQGHSDSVYSVAFSPDGKILASGSRDNTTRLWDVEEGQVLGQPLQGHSADVYSVAFSPDGKHLASGSGDKTIRLWDVEKGQALGQPLQGHSADVYSVAFSPDGKILASGSVDKTIRLWDVEKGQALGQPLQGHSSVVTSVAFSPDGKHLASGSGDKTIILWDVEKGQALGQPLQGHFDRVWSVAFSPDGKILASGSGDKTIILWDVEKGQALGQPLQGHSDEVFSVAFSPDGKHLASGSGDKTIILWDVEKGHALGQPLQGHFSLVSSVAFSPSGKILASGSTDGTIRLWNVEKGHALAQPLQGHSNYVSSVTFSPDGKILASGGGDKTIRLWDLEKRHALGQPLQEHSGEVLSVAFSPDGKILASGGEDKTIRLWDVEKGQALGQPLQGHSSWVSSVALSPDGKRLASGSWDKTIRLWDVEKRHALGQPLQWHSDKVSSVAFSPDSKILASGGYDGTVRLWDVEKGQALDQPLQGHSHWVISVALSPDGKILASGSGDNTIRLWDVEKGYALGQPLQGHSNFVMSVAFSPDGKILASGSEDKTVRLWDVNPESWVKKACAIVNRNFSQEEWQKYMGNRPHEKTCPDLPKDTLGAIQLTAEARALLKDGKTEEAKAKFAQARKLDARMVFGDGVEQDLTD